MANRELPTQVTDFDLHMAELAKPPKGQVTRQRELVSIARRDIKEMATDPGNCDLFDTQIVSHLFAVEMLNGFDQTNDYIAYQTLESLYEIHSVSQKHNKDCQIDRVKQSLSQRPKDWQENVRQFRARS